MKKIFLFLFITSLISCNQQQSSTPTDPTDTIRGSKSYQQYVAAYNDYVHYKEQRPQITTAYINKEIDAKEFEKKLEKNAKITNLKKQLVNTHWQLLQQLHDGLSDEYQIKLD